MERKNALKKAAVSVAVFLGIMHPIEAVIARRMARKRGRQTLPWMAATLLFGVFAMRRLKSLPPLEEKGGGKRR